MKPVYLSDQPARYCTSGQFICENGGAVHPERILDTFVLLLGNEGEYCIAVEDQEYRLTPGTFLLLPAGVRHFGTAPCAPGLRHYWCHFYLDRAVRLDQCDLPDAGEIGERVYLPIYGKAANPDQLRLIFHQLIDRSRSGSLYREPICNHLLNILLMELSDGYVRQVTHTGEGGKADYIAAQVLEWIRLNSTSVTQVSEVANHFGYNCEYLTTLIKRVTGKTLAGHITDNKIAEGKRLLLCTDKPIKEIATLCGFHSDKYFLRVFRKCVGLSPGEFRTAYCKVHYNII